uniref:C2H2-type domain-containing protein n=1 Tax=Aegilops tauschii subsp. strangulata TaxID=200361 RepID=A0A453CPI1_AEGTS
FRRRPPRRRLLLALLLSRTLRFLSFPRKLVFLAISRPSGALSLARSPSLAMAKNTCKLCCRRFASPRALAGHMRSHSIKVARSQQISSASSASTSLAAGDGDDARMAIQAHVLRGKPKRRARLAESDFSDRESEAEYPSQSPGAKRVHGGSRDAEPVSSVSDAATPEEDVALSLMMLSRDSWPAVAAWTPSSYRVADSDD